MLILLLVTITYTVLSILLHILFLIYTFLKCDRPRGNVVDVGKNFFNEFRNGDSVCTLVENIVAIARSFGEKRLLLCRHDEF